MHVRTYKYIVYCLSLSLGLIGTLFCSMPKSIYLFIYLTFITKHVLVLNKYLLGEWMNIDGKHCSLITLLKTTVHNLWNPFPQHLLSTCWVPGTGDTEMSTKGKESKAISIPHLQMGKDPEWFGSWMNFPLINSYYRYDILALIEFPSRYS